jgi:hypothetical protein
MNIAHIESKPVPGGQRSVSTLLRRCAVCCLIGVAAMSAAVAGPRDRDRDRDGDRQYQREPVRSERPQRQSEPRRQERQPRQFDTRAEEQRRDAQDQQNAQNNAEAFRRSGRLTPDERRDLRRQINEAGADIYQTRPRR